MIKKKYTIKDIANLAGVSKGTVDRVLHKRGRVSQKAFEKVDAVLKKIDYHPNPIARNLKINKIYSIAVLLPDHKVDPYWGPAYEGILQAREEFVPFGVVVQEYFYHPHKKSSFVSMAKEALESQPDALLLAPLFHDAALKVIENCREQKIVIASFNNTIDTLHKKYFIGQDLYQSGRVAASLVDKMIGNKAAIAIIHIDLEPHMQQKEKGFKSFFSDQNQREVKIVTHNLNTDNTATFKEQVTAFIADNDLPSAIFITNSKAYLLVEELERNGQDTLVVGYDLLEENINFLKNGNIDFLIHQKPKRQAYLGVDHIAEHFLFGKNIPAKQLLPIDVITSENVHYYLN